MKQGLISLDFLFAGGLSVSAEVAVPDAPFESLSAWSEQQLLEVSLAQQGVQLLLSFLLCTSASSEFYFLTVISKRQRKPPLLLPPPRREWI